MPLAKKFKAVNTSTLRITQEDKVFCEKVQKEYKDTLTSLDQWEEEMLSLKGKYLETRSSLELTKSGWDFNLNNSRSKAHNKGEELPWSEIHAFNVEKPISTIRNYKRDLLVDATRQIGNYFNEKYALKLSFSHDIFLEKVDTSLGYYNRPYREQIKDFSYEEIVKGLLRQCSGLTFYDMGIDLARNRFRDNWLERQSRLKIVGNKLHIENGGSSLAAYKWAYSSLNSLQSLLLYLSLFETGKYGNIFRHLTDNDTTTTIHSLDREDVNPKGYGLPEGSKVTGFKTYKNGKLTLTFANATLPHDFLQYFESYTLRD